MAASAAGARWAREHGSELMDRIPTERIEREVRETVGEARERINGLVQHELRDLRKAIRRQRRRLGRLSARSGGWAGRRIAGRPRRRRAAARRSASGHGIRVDAGHARVSRRGGAARRCALLPGEVAELLRAFPYDFLYGSIAADTSIAKKYAADRPALSFVDGRARDPRRRRRTSPLRAFSLGYLAHLAADVDRAQSTSCRSSSRSRRARRRSATATGRAGSRRISATACARQARELILLDHSRADAHARPHPQPDDLQHADQPPDLPRDGARRGQRSRGSGSSA